MIHWDAWCFLVAGLQTEIEIHFNSVTIERYRERDRSPAEATVKWKNAELKDNSLWCAIYLSYWAPNWNWNTVQLGQEREAQGKGSITRWCCSMKAAQPPEYKMYFMNVFCKWMNWLQFYGFKGHTILVIKVLFFYLISGWPPMSFRFISLLNYIGR